MWLLEARSRSLAYFADEREIYGRYAILSHTWQDGEVSFQDIKKDKRAARALPGYTKIEYACFQAERDGLKYVWVDTCCIDKTSSAELSEAINSMFRWYFHAAVCYAYLADVPATTSRNHELKSKQAPSGLQREREIQGSRWFKRCWTLQELVAPDRVVFYNRFWRLIGDKAHLLDELSTVSGVDVAVLIDRQIIWSLPVARRISWSSRRSATRLEDEAYSLLGILNVSMPLLYGEGRKAFQRLQEEVLKSSIDHSILAWDPWMPSHYGLLFSPSPFGFRNAKYIQSHANVSEDETYELANKGLRISLPTWSTNESIIAVLNCRDDSKSAYRPYALKLKALSPTNRAPKRASHLVCEIDRVSEELSRKTLYVPEGDRAWQDLMIVRESSTATIFVHAASGIRIFGAFPENDWYPRRSAFRLRCSNTGLSWGYIMMSHLESQKAAILCFGPAQQNRALRLCWNAAIPSSTKESVSQKIERTLISTRSKVARMQLGSDHYAFAAPFLTPIDRYGSPESLQHSRIGASFYDATWSIFITVLHVKSTTLARAVPHHWPSQTRGLKICLDFLPAIASELWKPSMSMKSPFVILPASAAPYLKSEEGSDATMSSDPALITNFPKAARLVAHDPKPVSRLLLAPASKH